jgi:hypothetical protein
MDVKQPDFIQIQSLLILAADLFLYTCFVSILNKLLSLFIAINSIRIRVTVKYVLFVNTVWRALE